ncbi:MAG: cation-translocating P-type ATPase [Acetanaerobacterium sp.]
MNWHSINIAQLCRTYGTGERTGLVEYRSMVLREKFGENILIEPPGPPFSQYLRRHLCSLLNINALVVFVLSLALLIMGRLNWVWAMASGLFALGGILLGAWLAFRAKRPLKRFSGIAVPTALVVRGGTKLRLPASQLVPGDLIVLGIGDRVPADARLLECEGLRCDEAILTGRALPALKRADVLLEADTPLADRINMVYMGCGVISGSGRAVVTATSMQTELGHSIVPPCEQSDTLVQTGGMFRRLGVVSIAATALSLTAVTVFSLATGSPLSDFMETGVAMAAAAVLTPLTAASAAVLRMGERRLALRHAVIKKTGSLETLGQVSVICTEKNGTLTQNQLTVDTIWAGGAMTAFSARLAQNALALLKLCALCSNAVISFEDGEEHRYGSPAEIAVLDAAMRNGMKREHLCEDYPRAGELPFTSERMRMTTINLIEGVPVVIVKGGFELLCPMCTTGPLDKAKLAHTAMCENALQVVAIAFKPLESMPQDPSPAQLECDLTLAGLIGLSDPLHPDAGQAMRDCRDAGVRPVIMTNDHIKTACATARALHILRDDNQAISGDELSQFSDEELLTVVESLVVYARINEQDKARVVRAWQQKGHTVLALGSGMRELPAIEAADIGCCLDEHAGEVLKSACDVLVTDHHFSTVLEAVRESRAVTENLSKSARYLLSSCTATFFTAAAALPLGLTQLIALPQVLLLNLFVSLCFALALGTEPSGRDRNSSEGQGDQPRSLLFHYAGSIFKGIVTAVFAVGAYLVGAQLFITDLMEPAHTVGCAMAFYVLLLCQPALAGSCRSRTRSSLSLGLFSSPFFNVAMLLTAILSIVAALLPPAAQWLTLAPVSIVHWGAAVIIFFAVGIILELTKIPALVQDLLSRRTG